MNSSKKSNSYVFISFLLVLVAGMMLGNTFTKLRYLKNHGQNIKYKKYDKLQDVVQFIKNNYVDTVDMNSLEEKAILKLVEELDPHSRYIKQEKYHREQESLSGEFQGIGVQFRVEEDTIVILRVIPGMPSEKVGVVAGDRIILIADDTVAGVGITSNTVMKRLKGKKGTTVDISVLRKKVKKLLNFTIKRDVIPLHSIDVAFMEDEETGYIKLSRFSATTYKESTEAVSMLKKQGLQNLIIDLRGNTGGYLQTAIQLADEILEDNELIVYTEGLHRTKNTAYATRKGDFELGNTILLIDEFSASASEILAGAIQDNDRGLIVGRRSFGKGLVQEQHNLLDGSALRLTIARYYTPSGRSIQKPYDKGNIDDYEEEIYHRYTNGETKNQDSISFDKSLKYFTKNGRVVYGGGGIMPDIFVPADDYSTNIFYKELIHKGLIYRFAFEYTDSHREALRNYETAQDFIQKFGVSQNIYDSALNYFKSKEVKPKYNELAEAKDEIKTLLKAYIARNLFDDEGFYPIYLQTDKTYQKALEILQKNKDFSELLHSN